MFSAAACPGRQSAPGVQDSDNTQWRIPITLLQYHLLTLRPVEVLWKKEKLHLLQGLLELDFLLFLIAGGKNLTTSSQ